MGNVKQCLFGTALVNIRESLHISQYQLARNSGIPEEYLNKLEISKREPKARMIIRLGRGLDIPPGDLLNEMDRLMRAEEMKQASPQDIPVDERRQCQTPAPGAAESGK